MVKCIFGFEVEKRILYSKEDHSHTYRRCFWNKRVSINNSKAITCTRKKDSRWRLGMSYESLNSLKFFFEISFVARAIWVHVNQSRICQNQCTCSCMENTCICCVVHLHKRSTISKYWKLTSSHNSSMVMLFNITVKKWIVPSRENYKILARSIIRTGIISHWPFKLLRVICA